jgi:hypothetical protein
MAVWNDDGGWQLDAISVVFVLTIDVLGGCDLGLGFQDNENSVAERSCGI